jgi:NADH-ubiquinone oxidoreductase chain 2
MFDNDFIALLPEIFLISATIILLIYGCLTAPNASFFSQTKARSTNNIWDLKNETRFARTAGDASSSNLREPEVARPKERNSTDKVLRRPEGERRSLSERNEGERRSLSNLVRDKTKSGLHWSERTMRVRRLLKGDTMRETIVSLSSDVSSDNDLMILIHYRPIVRNVAWLGTLAIFITIFLCAAIAPTSYLCYNNLIIDNFTYYFKIGLLISTACIILISLQYFQQEAMTAFESIILILMSTCSMLFMISAFDLITMYLAIELQSLCFYVLAASKRNSEFSTEAGLKYFILGAFSSGILLFGCSLIYGFTGVTNLEELAKIFTTPSSNLGSKVPLGSTVIVENELSWFEEGAARRFQTFSNFRAVEQLWQPNLAENTSNTPDALPVNPLCFFEPVQMVHQGGGGVLGESQSEGAKYFEARNAFTAPWAFFESSAKLASESHKFTNAPSSGIYMGILFLAVGFLFKITAVPFHMWAPDVYEGSPTNITAFFSVAPKIAILANMLRVFMYSFYDPMWQQLFVFCSVASMILGAFAALSQNKIKRLLAFSSIGHIGYLLIGFSCGTIEGIQSLLIGLFIYVFMTMNIFTVILALRQNRFKYISDLGALAKTNPILAITISITMFSFAGIPPLAGFCSKFYLFFAALGCGAYLLALIGIITSVISCFYYIRLVKIMYFDTPMQTYLWVPMDREKSIILGITIFFITFFFLYPSPLFLVTHKMALSLCL